MRFRRNQEIVCTVPRSGWHRSILSWLERIGLKSMFHGYGPDKNEIVTVESYDSNGTNILLKEYAKVFSKGRRYAYNEIYFEPVADISELTEILEQQPEHA